LYKAGVDGRAGLEWSAGAEVLAQCQTGAESGGGWVGFCDSLQAAKRQEILGALREAGEATAHLWEVTSPADLEEALGCMWDDARFRAARARLLGASRGSAPEPPASEKEQAVLYRRLLGRGLERAAQALGHLRALRGRVLMHAEPKGWTLEEMIERPESPSRLRRAGLDVVESDALLGAFMERRRAGLVVSEAALGWLGDAAIQRNGRGVLFLAGCAQKLPEDLAAEVEGLRQGFAAAGWVEAGFEEMEGERAARERMLDGWFQGAKRAGEAVWSPSGASLDEP
jgi:hypothetical protein